MTPTTDGLAAGRSAAEALAPGADDGLDAAILELTVGPVAHGGHCVARHEGQVVFVRHALPGERVRAVVTASRGSYLRADAVEILQASEHRVVPPCPFAGACGGCDWQHAELGYQRELKTTVLREQLRRLGGLTESEVDSLGVTVRAVPGVPGEPDGQGWRTRVQYTVDSTGRAGLLAHRSHQVVPVDRCLIAHPAVRDSDVLARSWPDDSIEVIAGAREHRSERASEERTGPADGPTAGAREHRSERASEERTGPADGPTAGGEAPATVLARRAGAAPTVVAGPATVTERAVGRSWRLDPAAFWQVHPAAAGTLAEAVVELLEPRPADRVWDLYGGAGLFAAALAPHVSGTGRLTVVEGDPLGVAAARENLRDLTTVTVVHADVRRALANPRWRSVDLVILDPPRSGAGPGVVASITARRPRAIAYVACDPAALARDLRAFRSRGYEIAHLRAYDLFPHTSHLESVALLTQA